MSYISTTFARRAALRQSFLRRPATSTPIRRVTSKVQEAGLDTAPKRDPELYVLLTVMVGAFGFAGWYLGSSPTTSTSESNIRIGEGTMPWEQDDESKTNFKYQYHPYGDVSKPLKNAPSALNEVVIPNVTLPKDLHDRFNKYGKEL
ncbi:hypothetical protein PAAG_05911 [Paracoccidioides lutzii Pb01]|uniref:Uncharacterized protein n=1 Tax=Paracoccidioides lutzii (strain ATCC MYA-826 / Pb01) TaxID=502779 RepID=C1H570_PARBA|nr:hypothetical protein PAAG_05911 [Paracoccidioides lutzii Pb01]EEH34864.1 hypothetical protein PAAG_05911 [Paracoccidioides lutzii Pb01]